MRFGIRSKSMKEKTLHNSDVSGARKNVPDIKVVGNGDSWKLLCKASSQEEGWMKSTKARCCYSPAIAYGDEGVLQLASRAVKSCNGIVYRCAVG